MLDLFENSENKVLNYFNVQNLSFDHPLTSSEIEEFKTIIFSINDLTQTMLKQINNFLNKNYIINKDLQYKINNNIKSKTLINTYRGFRLKNKLPSHGQNTHSNGKTAKKIN